MTPHSFLDNQPARVGFPVSSPVLGPEFLSTMRPGELSHVGGGHGYEEDSSLSSEGVATGMYREQDMFPDMGMSFKASKHPF